MTLLVLFYAGWLVTDALKTTQVSYQFHQSCDKLDGITMYTDESETAGICVSSDGDVLEVLGRPYDR